MSCLDREYYSSYTRVFPPKTHFPWKNNCFHPRPLLLPILLAKSLMIRPKPYFSDGQFFFKKSLFCDICKMKPNCEALTIPELRFLAKYRGLRRYSKLRKGDLINLLRFDPEELDNEDEVNTFSDSSTITEEGTQKQFDPEELDNEVDTFSNGPTITEEGAQKQFDPEESDNEK